MLVASPPDVIPPDGCIQLLPPTKQTRLDGTLREGIFMDTGTGRPESGMFGNTRKYADGSPRFHEGIDIAPLPPWHRGTPPTDIVCAAAEGRVVYVNTCAQNPSLYGNYVVMTHSVTGFGEIYTLYGHLARFAQGLRAGIYVRAGSPLGIMGNTPDIPMGRAHLHFEIGICMNRYYPLIDEQHGIWNGANLYGFDPCDAFREQAQNGYFNVVAYLRAKPVAFRVVVPPFACSCSHKPFLHHNVRYTWAIDVSAEGIPLRMLPSKFQPPEVTVVDAFVNEAELAKGRPFIKKTETGYVLSKRGETWIENLIASPSHLPKNAKRMGEVG